MFGASLPLSSTLRGCAGLGAPFGWWVCTICTTKGPAFEPGVAVARTYERLSNSTLCTARPK